MGAPEHQSESAERILLAAARLFSQKGYAATTVREIVEASAVTPPSLYYHFGSKEGLCYSMFSRVTDLITARVSNAMSSSLDAAAKVVEVVWAFLSVGKELPEFTRAAVALLYGPEGQVSGLGVREYAEGFDGYFSDAAACARTAGLIGVESEQRLAITLRCVVAGSLLWPGLCHRLVPSRELAARIVDDLLYGFSASGTGANVPALAHSS